MKRVVTASSMRSVAIASALAAVSSPASALDGDNRVLIVSGGDEHKLVGELALRGVAPMWETNAAPCTAEGAGARGTARNLRTVLCIDDRAYLLQREKKGIWSIVDVIDREEDATRSMHLAEVVRARLGAEPDRSGAEGETRPEAPAPAVASASAADDAFTLRGPGYSLTELQPDVKRPPVVPFPKLALGLGMSYIHHIAVGGSSSARSLAQPGFTGSLDLTALPWVKMHNELTWGASPGFDATNGHVTTRLGAAHSAIHMLLRRPDNAFVPSVGAGLGLLWLHVAGESPNPGFRSARDSSELFSAYTSLDAGASMRLYGPVRLAFDGRLGLASNTFVVRSNNFTRDAAFGPVFYGFGARLEVMR